VHPRARRVDQQRRETFEQTDNYQRRMTKQTSRFQSLIPSSFKGQLTGVFSLFLLKMVYPC
jgi:hypothetical protein